MFGKARCGVFGACDVYIGSGSGVMGWCLVKRGVALCIVLCGGIVFWYGGVACGIFGACGFIGGGSGLVLCCLIVNGVI